MKYFVFLLLLLPIALHAQGSVEEIKASFNGIFTIEVNRHHLGTDTVIGAGVRIHLPDRSHVLYPFLRDNEMLVYYLLMNRKKFDPRKYSAFVDDQAKAQALLMEDIESDDEFNDLMIPMIQSHLTRNQDYHYQGDRYVVWMDQLIEICVRFFYVDKIFPDGSLGTHLCFGINGMSTLSTRSLLLEAFCYDALLTLKNSSRDKAFEDALQIAKGEGKDADTDTRLEMIRKKLWELLSKDRSLQYLLQSEYEKKKEYLPFKLST